MKKENNYDEELKKVLEKSKEICIELKHPYIGTEHFVASVLFCCNRYKKIFNIDYDDYLEALIDKVGKGHKAQDEKVLTPKLKEIIKDITSVDNAMFRLFIDEKEGIGYRILSDEFYDLDTLMEIEQEIRKLVYKYKGKYPKYLVDLSSKEYVTNPAIGREVLIEEIEKILLKMNKPNVLLLGDAGVGKTAIVEGLAYKIKNGEVNKKMKDYKVLSVSSSTLVAGTKYRGECEEKIERLCEFLKQNKNVILFVDEMHTTMHAGGAEGAIDMANILKPYLARGDIKMIGATTLEESKIISKDSAYTRRFTAIKVDEPTISETSFILKKSIPKFENFYDIKIDEKLMDIIVKESKELKGKNPDKCIDILENICSDTIWNNEKTFDKKDIQRVIENMIDREKQFV